MSQANQLSLADKISANLPFLRRYARALTGSRDRGDRYAVETLEAILEDESCFDQNIPAKIALFKAFQSIRMKADKPTEAQETGLAAQAQKHLATLTRGSREALLLHTLEEFTQEDVAEILGISEDDVRGLIGAAYEEMAASISGKVMIIEDEAIIAVDLESLVSAMGHTVTGTARTEESAMALFERERPDLVLSDIQLADGSNGIDAVNRIIDQAGDLPVIFITAYPERLLTGKGPEPAFLISKPYTENQVRSAVSQAMFFASSAVIEAA